MKRFSILARYLMITLIISACGAGGTQATPTLNAVDLQRTIVAGGVTAIAETLAAIPTATPPPTFTDTPVPTITPLPSPSSAVTLTLIPNANSGSVDPCINQTLPESLQGQPVRMRIDNSTRVTVSVTVYLQRATPETESQCGYRSYTLAQGDSIVIHDLVEGCYSIWAWNPDPDAYFIVTNGTNCIYSSDTAVFDISTSSISLRP